MPRYQIGKTQGIVERTRPFCSLCYLHNTDIESLIYSIHEISVMETKIEWTVSKDSKIFMTRLSGTT